MRGVIPSVGASNLEFQLHENLLSTTTDFDFFLSEVVEDFFLPLFGAVGAGEALSSAGEDSLHSDSSSRL